MILHRRFIPPSDIAGQVSATLCSPDGFTRADGEEPFTHVRLSSNFDCATIALADAQDAAKVARVLAETVLAGVDVRLPDGEWAACRSTNLDCENPRWRAQVNQWASEITTWARGEAEAEAVSLGHVWTYKHTVLLPAGMVTELLGDIDPVCAKDGCYMFSAGPEREKCLRRCHLKHGRSA